MKRRLFSLAALAVAVCAIFLARWQFDRAAQKRALQESFAEAAAAAPLDLTAAAPFDAPDDFVYRRAVAVGRFIPAGEILIDNRILNRRPGYLVVTPFAIGAGEAAAIMVDRGWIAAAADRSRLPPIPKPPSGEVTVRGVLLPDDEGALELSAQVVAGKVWQNLHLKKYAAETGRRVLPLFLRAADSGLPALPARPRLNPERNAAYAWQWIALAAVAVIFAALPFFRRDK